jgi:hypothetical protein
MPLGLVRLKRVDYDTLAWVAAPLQASAHYFRVLVSSHSSEKAKKEIQEALVPPEHLAVGMKIIGAKPDALGP